MLYVTKYKRVKIANGKPADQAKKNTTTLTRSDPGDPNLLICINSSVADLKLNKFRTATTNSENFENHLISANLNFYPYNTGKTKFYFI